MKTFDFGIVGLGVMGRNLAYNIGDNGYNLLGFDADEEKRTLLEDGASPNTNVKGVQSFQDLVDGLSTPRKILLMVPAGNPVDSVIKDLKPLLQEGDIIIDGGNSYYKDTNRRVKELETEGIHFMGMGISGGEKGARFGPSIMPGGDLKAYDAVKPFLEAISTKVGNDPCTAYMGKDAAGHYVKMVHNGIEYAIMQLISEAYDILHRGLGLDNDQLHQVFKEWNDGELNSFLIEITRDIFKYKDTEGYLLDFIMDKAGSKGTGKWTSQDAMDLGVAIPTIDASVSSRTISAYKEDRVKASKIYPSQLNDVEVADKQAFIDQVKDGLYLSILLSYAQGLAQLNKASEEYNLAIPLKDVVKIWRGGCIIRSVMLEKYYQAFINNPELTNILLDENISALAQSKAEALQEIVIFGIRKGLPTACLSSSLAYFEAFKTERLPINLVQAQRDYFGAHTYQRLDVDGTFHTQWDEQQNG
ncbi:6-phosphogluconate dehydrogenase (decarboxylating) [Chishuiella changwenlii]|uniref:6-phosphogluconate dehydrogenase, decarboxylating n=1 Tax=Chishuiella changwenlii TaxID=1434701 RepID=A0A1M6Y2A7_9FLAO|nr:NADP-dependent phosphogluconate dehydrogenase [Chishuiella changwenlii]GGE93748.1 6-phosphogluconate dehydrogenase, NADP(+)-dependent, decarboxylating [Chishuiella changwenlii]SHL12382.1 6-phosphogluconate dehydrogenase (decarboxylating) [Chishuiella changwenlii]